MKIKEVLEKSIYFFKQKKLDTPRLDAELIISYALNFSRMDIYLKYDQPLTEAEINKCRDLITRRGHGEPVAYICGEKEFFGFPFKVNKNVLIPRPETEHIVEQAEKWFKAQLVSKTSELNIVNILDIGTGSGCLGVTLAKKIPQARVLAMDISKEALELASENAKINHVSDQITFIEIDASDRTTSDQVIRSFFAEGIDILVSNPPYISIEDSRIEENVKKYEPHSALFAKNEGLGFLLEWSMIYTDYLNKDSICLFEFGQGQGLELNRHFEKLGVFQKIEIIKDLSGNDRIICGVKNG